ncbi:MAG: LysM peptidoglycan-binding domain-containing protein, partial [Deltaproteobacteria bacterium]|nr:LysM peptidoglycan-binding domain-containing protein [Deltaproteobacteria bacterium]
LALAAYNGGRGRVSRALEAQGVQDFYDLRLPRETERYVFRALAAKLVMENPEGYGIRLEKARLYFPEDAAVVELTITRSSVPLTVLTRAAGLSYRGLRRLNPWMTGADLPRGSHRVRVPSQRKASFGAAVARWEAENPDLKTVRHKVRKGETLEEVAKRNGVSVADLCVWNNLDPTRPLRKGQELTLKLPR